MIKKEIKGMDYFILALIAFGCVGLELVLVLIEPLIYGQEIIKQHWTSVAHWLITTSVWSFSVYWILKHAKKEYAFKLYHKNRPVKLWQWVAIVIIIVAKIYVSYQSWGGFKPLIEFNNLGSPYFYFQYIYYFAETLLFSLIVIFAQMACEKWFKKKNIPYGGIACGITWGLAHIFTKGSVTIGVLSLLIGLGFGSIYLLINRDTRKTFLLFYLLFVL